MAEQAIGGAHIVIGIHYHHATVRPLPVRESINPRPSCWTAPTLIGHRHPRRGEHAVIAAQPIAAGELLAVFGGDIVSGHELFQAGPGSRRVALQVDEDLFVVSAVEGPGDWFNHSCDPNAGLRGQLSLVARRAIARGEEVCFDYAMSDGSPYDEFACDCCAVQCRHQVTGDDWQRLELWDRYRGQFSPYLQARIDRLGASLADDPTLALRHVG